MDSMGGGVLLGPWPAELRTYLCVKHALSAWSLRPPVAPSRFLTCARYSPSSGFTGRQGPGPDCAGNTPLRSWERRSQRESTRRMRPKCHRCAQIYRL